MVHDILPSKVIFILIWNLNSKYKQNIFYIILSIWGRSLYRRTLNLSTIGGGKCLIEIYTPSGVFFYATGAFTDRSTYMCIKGVDHDVIV